MTDHVSPAALAAYFDGASHPSDAAAHEQHLRDCVDCRSSIAAMAGAQRAVGLLPVPDAPDDIWNRILGRLADADSQDHAGPRAPTRPPLRRSDGRMQPVGPEPDAVPGSGGQRERTAGRRRRRPRGKGWLGAVLVLTVLAAILLATPLGNTLLAAVEPEEEGIDYAQYVGGLVDAGEMAAFTATYGRRRIALQSDGALTELLLGRDLLELRSERFVPRAAYTLTDRGRRAVQVTYRVDGSLVDVFRQRAEDPMRMDGLALKPREIAGERCEVAETASHRAVVVPDGAELYVIVVPIERDVSADVIRRLIHSRDSAFSSLSS